MAHMCMNSRAQPHEIPLHVCTRNAHAQSRTGTISMCAHINYNPDDYHMILNML